jgi:endonuclease/exonuclease/phosphatase family metal-dependent hydrolase
MAIAWLTGGCAAGWPAMVSAPRMLALAPCRTPVALDEAASSDAILWTTPAGSGDRQPLDAWCGTTGPPVIAPHSGARARVSNDLVVVSWNVHGGTADLPALIRRLESGALTGGGPVASYVLLLQEAYRADSRVPRVVQGGLPFPRPIRGGTGGRARADVVAVARSYGLAIYYVPSMRNGAPWETDEDRGNAILSTEPLSDFEAIELPFVRQRRVAIAATVSGQSADGTTWSVRVASAHLDNLASRRRLWIAATGTRVRQARGLVDALGPHDPLVLGGDFNTWFGFSDPAYRAVAAAVPDVAGADRRPTFGPFFRLDHLFSRLPCGWTVDARRGDDPLGSDHHPLVARVRMAPAAPSRVAVR